MAISSQVNSRTFVATGTAAPVSIAFKWARASDLVVTRLVAGADSADDGPPLTMGSAYAIGGNGRADPPTGFLTEIALEPGRTYRIERATAALQKYQPRMAVAGNAAAMENQLDDMVMTTQDIAGQAAVLADRAVLAERGATAPGLDMAGLLDGDIVTFRDGKLKRLAREAFIGKFYAGDASGAPVPATGTGGGDLALREDIAASTGAEMVGAPRPSGALARTIGGILGDVVRLRDFHAADGTSADTALAAAIAEAQGRGISRIVGGSGHYLLTNAALPAGMTLEGDGASTRLTVGASNSNILQFTNADSVTLRGLLMEGDGTSTDSTNGSAIWMSESAGLTIEDIVFDGFGHGPLVAKNLSGTRRAGPKIYRIDVRNTDTDSFVDIFMAGAWDSIVCEDVDMVCSSNRGILIADEGGYLWSGAAIRRGRFSGFAMQGVGCTDEQWDGTDRVFGFSVEGGVYRNIGSAAVKAKLSKGIIVRGIDAEGCGGSPENAVSGLYGTILVNSIGMVEISGNSLRNNGTAAIVTNGNDPYPKSRPDGFGMASYNVSANQIEGCGVVDAAYGNGIVHNGTAKSYIAANNQVRGVARYGVFLHHGALGLIQQIGLTGNHLLDSPEATHYAIRIVGAYKAALDGNICHNFPGDCVVVENSTEVSVGPQDRAGDSAISGRCYTFTNCLNIFFDGQAASTFYDERQPSTAYALGDRVRLNANDVVECCQAGTTASGSAPALTDGLATDGTVVWNWVQGYRKNDGGIYVAGTAPQLLKIGAGARFDYIVGPGVSGSGLPSSFKWAEIASGEATLAAGAAAVTFGTPQQQPNANYKIILSGDAAETFSFSARATGGFTINSSNGSSTAKVCWRAFR